MAKAATADELEEMAGRLANGADITYEQADSVFLAYKTHGRKKADPKTEAALSLWFDAVLKELKARRRSGVFAHTLPVTLFDGDGFFQVVSECLKSLPEEERASYVVGEASFVRKVEEEAKKAISDAGCGVRDLVEKSDARASYGPSVKALGFLRARTLNRLEALREYREVISYARDDDLLRGFDLWCELAEQKDPSVVNRIVRQRNFRDMDVVLTRAAVIEYLDRVGMPVLRACCRHLCGVESWDILLAPDAAIPNWPKGRPEDLFNFNNEMVRPRWVTEYVESGIVRPGIPERRGRPRSQGARGPEEVSALDAMVSAVDYYIMLEKHKEELIENLPEIDRF